MRQRDSFHQWAFPEDPRLNGIEIEAGGVAQSKVRKECEHTIPG
jgi:hypothetical protein